MALERGQLSTEVK